MREASTYGCLLEPRDPVLEVAKLRFAKISIHRPLRLGAPLPPALRLSSSHTTTPLWARSWWNM
jgi:hypothetical protein